MDTIKTSSGKIYECDTLSAIDSPCRLYIRIANSTLSEVATIFGDKEETKELLYGNILLIGYIKLLSIVIEDAAIRVVLTKE
jgi:hypothetical protein